VSLHGRTELNRQLDEILAKRIQMAAFGLAVALA
jgi:hypothetical protein